MKRRIVGVCCALAVCLALLPAFSLQSRAVTLVSPASGLAFTDVSPDAWYREAVEYVVDRNIMSGTSADTFSPDTTLTRAMLVQLVYAMDGKPNIGSHTFGDVTHDAWYDKAVAWANTRQVMTGYGEGRFMPDNLITREQIALILYNYAKLHSFDTRPRADLSAYADGDSVSSWAQEAMTWIVGAGIFSGRDGNLLDPSGNSTRAEIAQILMNLCEFAAQE